MVVPSHWSAARSWLVAVTALAGAGLAIAACNASEEALLAALGQGCLINSDCNSGLVCVFRRCHQPCATSEDCALDDRGEHLRCVIGEKPDHVCQLDSDARCQGDADCPGKQICGVDDRCRDECAADRDCMPGQLCRQATCADAGELEGDLLLLASASGLGKPCTYNSQCPAGPDGLVLFCRHGRCDYGCFEERDCPAFYACTTGDEPATPGNCELIGPRGKLYCDPDEPQLDPQQGACACPSSSAPTGPQICKPDGSGYEACPCNG